MNNEYELGYIHGYKAGSIDSEQNACYKDAYFKLIEKIADIQSMRVPAPIIIGDSQLLKSMLDKKNITDKKDAERYRWMRSTFPYSAAEVDTFIDASIIKNEFVSPESLGIRQTKEHDNG